MKSGNKINLGNVALVILIIAGGLLVYLIYDLRRTEQNLAESLINKTKVNAELELGRYFSSAERLLNIVGNMAEMGELEDLTDQKLKNFFVPILRHNRQIKYTTIVTPKKYEYNVFLDKERIVTRESWFDKWGPSATYKEWKVDSSSMTWSMVDEWKIDDKKDMDQYEWYIRTLEAEPGTPVWTGPLIFKATQELGMTITTTWRDVHGQKNALGFGILLARISEYTQHFKVSRNGKVFILSDQGQYIGLPYDEEYDTKKEVETNLLQHVDSSDYRIPGLAYNYWRKEHGELESSFKFDSEEGEWWGSLNKFYLTDDKYMTIGVMIPEADILSELHRTKRIIIGSFVFILILTSFLLYSYNQTRRANNILDAKNTEISRQKLVIEEKNKDILDSINYASRLQTAMLPPRDRIGAFFKQYFILFKPKDVVAGDFYWMECHDRHLLFAAADCTGHGVPGSIVSVVCINALNRAVKEFNLTDPGLILDETRDIVISEFGKTSESVSDGMDIALISVQDKILKYAGANNPLWMIRNGELTEYKANKQPIGKYAKNELYRTHTIECRVGDSFYMFSDGFADQFGGENGKKFKSRAFKELLLSFQVVPMEEQGRILEEKFQEWKGTFSQVDDVCVVGIRI